MSNDNFVYMQLSGGLGNQMFQYCAGYITSKLIKSKFLITNAEDNLHNTKHHNYAQTLFTDASECLCCPIDCIRYYQPQPPFSSWRPFGIISPCRLEGYFQYYPTLEPFLPELVEKFREALHVKESTNTTFLHIRRGDYLELSEIHSLQGLDYYYNAYMRHNQILQDIPPRLLIFSDDIAWCKEQEWIQKFPNVEFYENDNELETLAEMARCGGGAIIANSTFSWWGAMLSKSQHVYYPSKWINYLEVQDLFPKHWVKI